MEEMNMESCEMLAWQFHAVAWKTTVTVASHNIIGSIFFSSLYNKNHAMSYILMTFPI